MMRWHKKFDKRLCGFIAYRTDANGALNDSVVLFAHDMRGLDRCIEEYDSRGKTKMRCTDCGALKHRGKCKWKPCEECEGKGRFIIDYPVAGYTPSRWMEFEERVIICDICDGYGEVVDSDAYWEND